ncbi:MAG: NAD(P)/FAD-dependent oxidoreductase [Mariprofundaceae bacterium]|nr:NAD(P)/FAD-dependent oxidoreductase [Mariprofundaceae bacterium]
MDSCDVLIVGGGPAGSSCAWKLKQASLDVLVLDKSQFPRDKVCAGWITPEVLQVLQIGPGEYAEGREMQPIYALRTGVIGRDALQTHYDKPVSYGIRRREFDHYLLQRSGARLQLGVLLKSIRRSGQEWIINEQIKTKLLIGAGGHFCPVARLSGETSGEKAVVAAKEIEFKMTEEQAACCTVSGEMPELYFCPDMLGYGWCFRKGDFLNVGLGRRDNHQLAMHVDSFISWLKNSGRIPFDIPAQLKGHAYHTYDQNARNKADDGMILIGDAAGLAFSESGEGILPAVKSGMLAADAVLACNGDYDRKGLARYEAALIKYFGNPNAFDPLDLLPVSAKQFLGRKILESPSLTRRVVVEGWFLHLSK